jgi:hypothetical protein
MSSDNRPSRCTRVADSESSSEADDLEPTSEDVRAALRQLDLTSCDFVEDSGCSDPACWKCHSALRPVCLRTLANNLSIAAMLYRAWAMHAACPAWRPGCNIEKAPDATRTCADA